MTTIASYTDLVTAVGEYLARDGDTLLLNRVPTFIQLAEAKFNRVLFHPLMEVRSITNVDTSASDPEFITVPLDFQSMRRIRLSSVAGKPRLEFMSQAQMEDYRYSRNNVVGQPQFYSIVGNEFELAPTPDANYTLEMVYRANIPALTPSNAVNWLLTLAPDLYLYGSLLEATPYVKDDERVALWATAFQTSIDQLNTQGARQPGTPALRLNGPTP